MVSSGTLMRRRLSTLSSVDEDEQEDLPDTPGDEHAISAIDASLLVIKTVQALKIQTAIGRFTNLLTTGRWAELWAEQMDWCTLGLGAAPSKDHPVGTALIQRHSPS